MEIYQNNIIILFFVIISGGARLITSESIRLIGPRCGDFFDVEKNDAKCGTTVTSEPSVDLNLGALCKHDDRLKLQILREDVDVEGSLTFKKNYIQREKFGI